MRLRRADRRSRGFSGLFDVVVVNKAQEQDILRPMVAWDSLELNMAGSML